MVMPFTMPAISNNAICNIRLQTCRRPTYLELIIVDDGSTSVAWTCRRLRSLVTLIAAPAE
jgi:hypothetical protein